MSHLCGKSCSRENKCCNNNDPVAGTVLFFTDAVSDIPPITSPTQTIGVNSLLRFTSQSLDITTSSGGGGGVGGGGGGGGVGGVGGVGTVVVDIEAPSEFIGPPGPAGPQGPVGQAGTVGLPGPSGNSDQQGTVATWYSGSRDGGPIPNTFSDGNIGFLTTGFPIEPFPDTTSPIRTTSNKVCLLTPKNSSGTVTNFQITLQQAVNFNRGPMQIIVGIYLYEYDDTLLTYNNNVTQLGNLTIVHPGNSTTNALYGNTLLSPNSINPGDAIGIGLTVIGSEEQNLPVGVGSYFAQVV